MKRPNPQPEEEAAPQETGWEDYRRILDEELGPKRSTDELVDAALARRYPEQASDETKVS